MDQDLKPGLSIFVICKNEERIIEQTLQQAAQLADEIILVDSGSSDTTLEIARRYTKSIYEQAWLGFGRQKNFALSKCQYEWCLSLDADEVLTDEVIAEIQAIVDSNPSGVAFRIARKLYIGDHFVRWGGYYPDKQLRLFRKGEAEFNNREVHESLQTQAKVCDLQHALDHKAYETVDALRASFIKYAELARQSSHQGVLIAALKWIYTLIYKYIFRLGFLEGSLGFKLALIHADYTFAKYS